MLKYNIEKDVMSFLMRHYKDDDYWTRVTREFLFEQYGGEYFPDVDFAVNPFCLDDIEFILVRRYYNRDKQNIHYDVYDYNTGQHVHVLTICLTVLKDLLKKIPFTIYVSKLKKKGDDNALQH